MVNKKIFVISDELFNGYSLEIDVDKMNNKKDIINEIVDNLRIELKKLKLENLAIKLLKCNFHIDNYNFEDIIKSKYNQKFWIFNHK